MIWDFLVTGQSPVNSLLTKLFIVVADDAFIIVLCCDAVQCESKTAIGLRARSIHSGIDINVRKLPTVFRWDGHGTHIYVSGSYDNWESKIPLVRR